VRPHDELDDAQAEPDAARFARQAPIDLKEPAEDPFVIARMNAAARVLDGEHDSRTVARYSQRDATLVRGVLAGVVE